MDISREVWELHEGRDWGDDSNVPTTEFLEGVFDYAISLLQKLKDKCKENPDKILAKAEQHREIQTLYDYCKPIGHKQSGPTITKILIGDYTNSGEMWFNSQKQEEKDG